MSESFETILGRINYGRYIDQIQSELKRGLPESAKGGPNIEVLHERLEVLLGKLSKDIAKEVGLVGSPTMVFMMSMSILATAWVAFTLRKETSDLTKSPEDRLVTIEMLDALDGVLASVIRGGTNYADMSPVAAGESTKADAEKAS